MSWPRLDTSAWNLSLGVVATSMLAACGPFVILEGETDTESVTETDPSPTDPSETDTLPPGQCNVSSDCEPGYECIGNVCMPYGYYCEDGGCCYGGTGGCCYDGCYYSECYSDEDCGGLEICSADYGYAYCQYVAPLPECEVPPVIPLALPDVDGGVVSLSFVDANGDAPQDLVMGGLGRAQLLLGPGAAPPVELPVPPDGAIGDAVAGDFDGDGDTDLALAGGDGRLLVIAGDGAGGWTLVNNQTVSGSLDDLVPLQWNGDEMLDLAATDGFGNAILLLNAGDGTFPEIGVLPVEPPVSSVVRTDFGSDGYHDLVVQDAYDASLFLGDFSGDYSEDAQLPGGSHGPRTLVSGPMIPGTPWEVVGHTDKDDWRMLELWNDILSSPSRFALLPGLYTEFMELGDYDGDSIQDVLLGGQGRIVYVHAFDGGFGSPWLECQSILDVEEHTLMTAGDFDGNGRADVVYGGFSSPVVLLSQ